MAFESPYSIHLIVFHDEWSSDQLGAKLSPLVPTATTSIGDAYTLKSGRIKYATGTVWKMRMHNDVTCDGERTPLEDTLRKVVSTLVPLSNVFAELPPHGCVDLEIHFTPRFPHAVAALNSEVLAMLSECHVRLMIEMSFKADGAS